ncbi:MAG: MFS transporter [Candidatus Fonsibacter lacus]|uniref:MFS transporter n=1 Tax=Candidatus Fonsibacter lacus TaxID=2576439 RepID=A0A966HRC8_9PROT|nr:MFS transporter [Candidatus Fonsibacter lacus]
MLKDNLLTKNKAIVVFLVFALAYFISTLIRASTATLSPIFSQELGLKAGDLGLLAGGYFLGFAAMQLPNGIFLDKFGPKKIILFFLTIALFSTIAFSKSESFLSLLVSRILIGIGVSVCLMAPLTGYRRWLALDQQQRANAWMLMSGALGMLASTLPIQLLLPEIGWRNIFLILAGLILITIILIILIIPSWEKTETPIENKGGLSSYKTIWTHPYFLSLVPLGFFNYGGLQAIQTLWAGPWMTNVSGYTPIQAAINLFWLNLSMLVTFFIWGFINPYFHKKGISTDKIIIAGVPLSFLALGFIIYSGTNVSGLHFALFLIASVFVSLAQPAVGMTFPNAIAGKALSSYNLVLFLGTFTVQWAIGVLIDLFKSFGYNTILSYQISFSIFALCCILSYSYFFIHHKDHLKKNYS